MSQPAMIGAGVLIAVAVASVWVCIAGLVRSRTAFDRLHFPGAAAMVAAPTIALATGLAGAGSATVERAWLISAILILMGSIVTHATARAEWLRTEGDQAGDASHDDP